MISIKINALLASLLLFLCTPLHSQLDPSIETITLNPHEDVRIVYKQLREKKIKHGKYTYYFRNKKTVEGTYVGGKKHGKWKRYYLDGTVAINAFYLQNKKHGTWEYYFQNKSKMASISFNRGKKKGVWTGRYVNGSLRSQLNYKNDTLKGSQKIYYKQWNIKPESASLQLHMALNIIDSNSNKFHAIERYYPNGKIFEKYAESENTKVGMYESFYQTGLPWRKLKYEVDGRLFSIFKYNNPVGREAVRGSFVDGNGELITYNSNGNKYSKTSYKNGFPDGKTIVYEEDKKELITGYFDDNIQTGTWKQYKPKIAKKELVVELQFIGTDSAHGTFFTSDLQARSSGEVIRNKRNNIWRSYYANNSLRDESYYKMDILHGMSKGYRDLNVLAHSGGYYYGLKVGTWKYYNDFGKVTFRENFSTQATADENYLFGDSCEYRPFLETVYYNTTRYDTKKEKQLSFIVANQKHMNFSHFLHDGRYSSWASFWVKAEEEVPEYFEDFGPEFPQYIPWEVEQRDGVVKDYDMGLFLQTLNPKKIKIKGDKTSPKLGVAMVVLELDEFGFAQNVRIVRGIDSEWNDKIKNLFSVYQFWEPALLLNQPIAIALQIKVPIELEIVKK